MYLGYKQVVSKIAVLLTLSLFVLAGCDDGNDKEEDIAPEKQEKKRVGDQYDEFSGRIDYHDKTIEAYEEGSKKRPPSSNFKYIADVKAPKPYGKKLSATGIAFRGNLAFVSYHWNNGPSDYAGAIEIIDLRNPVKPKLIAGLALNDTDLNEIKIQGNTVYAVGGRNLQSSGYNTSKTDGAVVEVLKFTGKRIKPGLYETWVPSFSANSVFRYGKKLYVASGNTDGGVFEFDLRKKNFLGLTNSDLYSNSKYGVKNRNNFIFLQGGANPKIHIHGKRKFNPKTKHTVNLSTPISPEDGKNVLRIDRQSQLAYVSSGKNGLRVYDMNSGNQKKTFTTSGNGLVNGIDMDKQHAYAAKGGEGLYILDKQNFNNIKVNFNQFKGSANYVRSNGKHVFVAHGKGGLKILSK